ncbi:Nudix family hydrolase [Derxia lacustris]|uniref:Nudix family hydrolase n=1 Tax=Derxia lacustris TaxID=764842 RepID=UPI001C3861C6|nr:Nudix family hydrolase [Derxia lacustris]
MTAPRRIVEVAVGVLLRADGRFMLGSRPAGKPYSGYWEFPGGKLEIGETVAEALARELDEEIGITLDPHDPHAVRPWCTIEHVYPHAHVRLHFMRVVSWQGEPHGREGQTLRWVALHEAAPAPLLPAALPCLHWLELPPVLALSQAGALGLGGFLARLDAALAKGLRFVELREPGMAPDDFNRLFDATLDRVRAAGAKLVVHSMHGLEWASRADGVHLSGADLAALAARPDLPLVGASVHSRAEIDRAAALGLDYAVLGHVLDTPSHPGVAPLGWDAFAALVRDAGLPVYAIGGLDADQVEPAQASGAHGVALMRAAWRDEARFPELVARRDD